MANDRQNKHGIIIIDDPMKDASFAEAFRNPPPEIDLSDWRSPCVHIVSLAWHEEDLISIIMATVPPTETDGPYEQRIVEDFDSTLAVYDYAENLENEDE